MVRRMPRNRTGTNGAPQSGLPDAFQRLARGGAQWAEAEFSLARAEVGIILRRIATGIGVAVAAIIFMLVSLVILAQTAVAALSHVLPGSVYAGLSVGLGLLICVILLAFVARNLLSARHAPPASPVLRWVVGATAHGDETR